MITFAPKLAVGCNWLERSVATQLLQPQISTVNSVDHKEHN